MNGLVPVTKAYVIFDLDGTVVDSRHRQATKADGSLDLEHWMERNKPDMIMRDTLLPLARVMRIIKRNGHKVIVCTARAYQIADEEFLAMHGLDYDVYLSRAAKGDMRDDASLKVQLLSDYFESQGFHSVEAAKPIMFEDNLKVIDAMIEIGITVYDANLANRRLAA
jgi:beta-phosphoglucomutase-like phosphatase (HAD superfamily)